VTARLLATPGIQKVPSPRLTLFQLRGFLSAEQCAAYIARIDEERRPSTVSDSNGDDTYRTSETCDIPATDPLSIAIDDLIGSIAGLDRIYGEPLQGQRYAVGQEFKAHTDYFEPTGADYQRYCALSGQRTWTFMVYLNEPIAGGTTRFKTIDKIIRPETGKLLAWNNRLEDGANNPATLHIGMKVRAGTKYVLTKWYRERPWI